MHVLNPSPSISAALVQAVADAHQRDADIKRRICNAMASIVEDGCAGAETDCSTLSSMLQVWLAVWVVSPALDEDQHETTLQLVKAEMHGF